MLKFGVVVVSVEDIWTYKVFVNFRTMMRKSCFRVKLELEVMVGCLFGHIRCPKNNEAVALLKQQTTAYFLLGHPVT